MIKKLIILSLLIVGLSGPTFAFDGVMQLEHSDEVGHTHSHGGEAALDSYSNVFSCVAGGCFQVNPKPLEWNFEEIPDIDIVFSEWFLPEVQSQVIDKLNEAVCSVTFHAVTRDLSESNFPSFGEITVVEDPELESAGLAERIVIYYTEFEDKWKINRGTNHIKTNLTGDTLIRVIIHEILHALGLDHSQGHSYQQKINGEWLAGQPRSDIPVMYPLIASRIPKLTFEDKLFIRASMGEILETDGSLSGNAYFKGEPMRGIVLTLINREDKTKSFTYAIDPLAKGDGSFKIDNIPAGTYTVRFDQQRLNSRGAGSGIGRYNGDDANFTGVRFWNKKNKTSGLSRKRGNRRSRLVIKAGEHKTLTVGTLQDNDR